MSAHGPIMPRPAVPHGLPPEAIQAEREAFTKRQEDSTQRDLAAGRASLAAEQAKLRLGTPAHVRSKDMGAAEAGAQASAGLAQMKIDSITYREDKVSKADPNIRVTGLDFRIACAECPNCGSNCDIAQKLPLTGDDWSNDPVTHLGKFGWKFDGTRWFCGDTCYRFWSQRMAPYAGGVTQPVAVTHVNDKSYAVKAYASEPVVTAPTPAITPAPSKPVARR